MLIRLIFTRLFSSIPALIGITVLVSLLLYLIPGDPALVIAGERTSEEALNRIRKEHGLDQNFFVRYKIYISRLVRFDLGKSYITGESVTESIKESFPRTIMLALGAMLLASTLGILIGVTAAVHRGSRADMLLQVLSLVGISTPVFWLGLILMLVFSYYLRWLPISGYGTVWHYILPCLTLGLQSAGYIARITRSSVLEILPKDYIKTARAKGLKQWQVIYRHALANAALPIITVIGLDFGSYLNGSVVTETIFGWPGLGRFLMESIQTSDYIAVQGTVLFCGLVFVMANLLVDILYIVLNPVIRQGNSH